MKRYRILPELKIRNNGRKVFLYNPWSDDIFELNKLSWEIALEISKGKTLSDLAYKLGKNWQQDYNEVLEKIRNLQKELIKWGILTHI